MPPPAARPPAAAAAAAAAAVPCPSTSPSLRKAPSCSGVNKGQESNRELRKRVDRLARQLEQFAEQNTLLKQQQDFMINERKRIFDEIGTMREQHNAQIDFLYKKCKTAHEGDIDLEPLPFGDVPSSQEPDPSDGRPRPMNLSQLAALKSMLESTRDDSKVELGHPVHTR
jgi:small-conductance mechanosensitive channel